MGGAEHAGLHQGGGGGIASFPGLPRLLITALGLGFKSRLGLVDFVPSSFTSGRRDCHLTSF